MYENCTEKTIKDTLKIKLLDESYTKQIVNFINKNIKNRKKLKLEKDIYVNQQILNNDLYEEINIRANLYNFFNEFIVLLRDGEIVAMMDFAINKNNLSKSINLNLIICNSEYEKYISNMIAFASEVLPKYSISEPTKIRTYIEEDSELSLLWKERLISSGLTIEAERKNELGYGKSLTAIVKKFERRSAI